MTKTFDSRIINAGLGGNNSRASLERISGDVFSHHPDLMILMVGTNDALNSGALVPLEEYAANLDALVARTLQAHCKVLLATVAPFHLPALAALLHRAGQADFHGTPRYEEENRERPATHRDEGIVFQIDIPAEISCAGRNLTNPAASRIHKY